MNAVVAYESIYGNTRRIAEAIADGLGGARVVPVAEADDDLVAEAELLVVGGPTHMHGMTTTLSRRLAVEGAQEDGHAPLEPTAADGPGLRRWLAQRSGDGRRAAAFDTRIDRSPAMVGSAARGIGRRLRHHGYELVTVPESFFVADAEGPLAEGELERARAWGKSLASVAVAG